MRRPRNPILMGQVERIATATEDPCPTTLTRQVLDPYAEKRPGQLVSITPKCHPDAGVMVWYSSTDGCVVLWCANCKAGVARLQLAADVPS